jgi:ubiquinone/menaquinone biosynthesis C-methylase UbiE
MKQYDQLSVDYHWLYSDEVLAGKHFPGQFNDLLKAIPQNSMILDCSCGIGQYAMALAEKGYTVWGSDESQGMIEQAKERSKNLNNKITFIRSTWAELPLKMDRSFDITFCLGNSIGHCKNKNEMILSLKGIHSTLKTSGLLVLDSRNWEKLFISNPRFTLTGTRLRNNIKCIPLYVWNFQEHFEDEQLIEVVLIFEEQTSIYERHYNITYHPFKYQVLLEILKEVGFTSIRSNFTEETDVYTITAKAG